MAAVVAVLPTLSLLVELPKYIDGDHTLQQVILARMFVVLVSVSVIASLIKSKSQPAAEAILSIYGVFAVGVTAFVVAFHTGMGNMAPTSAVAMAAMIYFFAPLQFPITVFLAVLMSVAGWIGWGILRGDQPSEDVFRLALWLGSVNLVGFFGSNAYHRTIRSLFWEQRQLAQQKSLVEQAYARERHAFEKFKQFAELISHEFRNPLAIVKSKAQLLQLISDMGGATDPDALPAIERAVDRLDALFKQWLASDSLSEDDMTIAPRPVVLVDLMRQVAGEAPLSAAHPIIFEPVPEDLVAKADPGLLRMVLLNILDNAVKYSPDGGEIHVHARLEGQQAIIAVRDHGMGIAAEKLGHVFDKYYRASHDGGVRGFGLGLFLAHRIMVMHEGALDIDSTFGEGTTVSLRLPVISPVKEMSDLVAGNGPKELKE